MRNYAAAGLLLLLSTLTAAAQGYGQPPSYGGQSGAGQYANPYSGGSSPYLQNYYNSNSQPLSPYLNLLRGGNTAVNYYYGVRPGTQGGAFGSPLSGMGSLGRQTFFPEFDTLYDQESGDKLDGIPPTGHMVGFRNTLNYYGAGSGAGMGRQQPRQGTGSGATTPSAGTGVR